MHLASLGSGMLGKLICLSEQVATEGSCAYMT